jgi:hypothetical protein
MAIRRPIGGVRGGVRQPNGDRHAASGLGSAHASRVDLDELRRLKTGQCFAISRGGAMKLQIARAPTYRARERQSVADE